VAVIAGVYVVLVVLNFAYFYPVFTGHSIPYADWLHRVWLSNWGY
jgi:dolichyl-phosphate-mannose--protein O-mannosyl transferase